MVYKVRFIEFYDFCLRWVGVEEYIDFYLVVFLLMMIESVYLLCDEIEVEIMNFYVKVEVFIYLELEEEWVFIRI